MDERHDPNDSENMIPDNMAPEEVSEEAIASERPGPGTPASPPLRNLRLVLSYDGSEFSGWQVQPARATVQGTLASAIGRLTGENVLPQGSGRTDAGVHALAQVATFTTRATIPAANWLIALNDLLPPSIRVTEVADVELAFHARKSALAKTYCYRIHRAAVCPPFLARYIWHYPFPLQEDAMIAAAPLVIGEHDFTSFAAVDPERVERMTAPDEDDTESNLTCPDTYSVSIPDSMERRAPSPVGLRGDSRPRPSSRAKHDSPSGSQPPTNIRTITSSLWTRESGELTYTVRGTGFLHHMVRNLVGTFLLVGKGTLQPEDIPRILAARNRSAAGATAPASGLYLVNVEY